MHDPLITTEALALRLDDPGLKVIDATWHLDGSDALDPFEACHIPGSVFFDIDRIADPATDLPHMLPTPEAFAEAVAALGISSEDEIVVYDQIGIRSAPRVWWTFRAFGHDRIRVLDGGFPKWLAEEHPVEKGPAKPAEGAVFVPVFRPDLVRAAEQILLDIESGRQLLDARPAGRFTGEAPEPRAGLRGGHIPGSRNLPFPDVIQADGTLKTHGDLAEAFDEAGVDLTGEITTTCGSGLTAGVLALAAARCGNQTVAVYDGSWAEWGGREDLPVVKGPA